MLYKEDWDKAQVRLTAWWHQEIVDRVPLQVRAPRAHYQPRCLKQPSTLRDRWTNIEWQLARAEEWFRGTFFGGEAFPCFWCHLGPDLFAAYLGAELVFGDTTTWVKPLIDDWAQAPPLTISEDNYWWQLSLQMTEAAVEAGAGKFFVGITDLHGGGDLLAALRGRENFCLDLVDRPDEVKQVMKKLTELWFTVYEAFHQRIQKRFFGSSTWLNVWAPGRWYPVSFDELALISPTMFRDFFLDDILAQVNWLDYSLFHLDGPDCLRHLDILLEIPKLNGIQWVPGARYASVLSWIPLLQKIQKAGKLVQVAVPPQEVEPLLSALSPKGLLLETWCQTEEEARSLLAKVSHWTRERIQILVPPPGP
ncbi:MAG: hypothetical protein NZ959_04025 [Armatimonadetes bacterium]|nr:hypothetical protein [Armatimonadota bacterium]MDW8122569.1 hypothetical protein [Armatimonadota bacterium]